MPSLHPRRISVELGAKRRLKSALSDAKKPKQATKKASAPVRSLDEEIAKRERPKGVAVGDYLESLRSAESAAAEAVDLSKQAADLADAVTAYVDFAQGGLGAGVSGDGWLGVHRRHTAIGAAIWGWAS